MQRKYIGLSPFFMLGLIPKKYMLKKEMRLLVTSYMILALLLRIFNKT